MRWSAIALLVLASACVTTTSSTRTGTGVFAPRDNGADDGEDPPIGLTLSVGSVTTNGDVILELRNYSQEPFVFGGTLEHPYLIVEVQSGSTHARHAVAGWRHSETYEVAAGERVQLKASITGASGNVRIGVRSHDYGYVVWTPWFAR
ncbi:MAG: hypothetical protein JO197_22460 [Acidobacteria bacterium]|nr:hypothetical protein [Acidobacteriota bacterium]MBV9474902.1 hypothetical protein [Acidobacteriota bacterium]